jgi:hypothetical protein
MDEILLDEVEKISSKAAKPNPAAPLPSNPGQQPNKSFRGFVAKIR